MEEKKDFITPPTNDDTSEREKLEQLESQIAQMSTILSNIQSQISQPQTREEAAQKRKTRLKEGISESQKYVDDIIKSVNPNMASPNNYYCHVNPPAYSSHLNSPLYIGASRSNISEDISNYSMDYVDIEQENSQLKKEIERLAERLNESVQWVDELAYNPGKFISGQMNRNMMLYETGQINKSYRERLKGQYPIRCTYCNTAIFKPEDAYDDTFPVGKSGQDIFCQNCVKTVVSPARISMVRDVLTKKNKKKKPK